MAPINNVSIEHKKGYLWITLPSEVTRDNNPQIQNRIETQLRHNLEPIALDFSFTGYILTMTIGLILYLRKRAYEFGKSLCLVNVSEKLLNQLTDMHLDRVIRIYGSENDMWSNN